MRYRNYAAVHSGKEPCCQACLDARTRLRFTTDLPLKVLMPNISSFPSLTLHISICLCLSLALLSHMLALPDSQPPLWIRFHSPQCCYGNQNFGTTVLQSCNGSLNLILDGAASYSNTCHLQEANTCTESRTCCSILMIM